MESSNAVASSSSSADHHSNIHRPAMNRSRRPWQRYLQTAPRNLMPLSHQRRSRICRHIQARSIDGRLGSPVQSSASGCRRQTTDERIADVGHQADNGCRHLSSATKVHDDERYMFEDEGPSGSRNWCDEDGCESSPDGLPVGNQQDEGGSNQNDMENLLQEACQQLQNQSSLQNRIDQLQSIRMQQMETILENVIQVVQELVHRTSNSNTTPGQVQHFHSSIGLRPAQSRRHSQCGCQSRPNQVCAPRQQGEEREMSHSVNRRNTATASWPVGGQTTLTRATTCSGNSIKGGRKRGSEAGSRNSITGYASSISKHRPVDSYSDTSHEAGNAIHNCNSVKEVGVHNTLESDNRVVIHDDDAMSSEGCRDEPLARVTNVQHDSEPSTSQIANKEISETHLCSSDLGNRAQSQDEYNAGCNLSSGLADTSRDATDSMQVLVKEEGSDEDSYVVLDEASPSRTSYSESVEPSGIDLRKKHMTFNSYPGGSNPENGCRQSQNASATIALPGSQQPTSRYSRTEQQECTRSLQEIFTSLTGSTVTADELFGHSGDIAQEQPSCSLSQDGSQQENPGGSLLLPDTRPAWALRSESVDQPSSSSGQRYHPQHFSGMLPSSKAAGQMRMSCKPVTDVARRVSWKRGVRDLPGRHASTGRLLLLQLTDPEEYDIRGILERHERGGLVLEELDMEKMPSIRNRRLLVQILVSYLIENGGRSLYPTAEQKTALAQAVVTQFPCMRDKLPGAEGHEYLYHKGQGFVEFRLKTLRTSACYSRRYGKKRSHMPRKSKEQQTPDPDNSKEDKIVIKVKPPPHEIMEKIQWLRSHQPTEENRLQIYDYFEATHNDRRTRIKNEHLTIADIVEHYPLFKDMPELIEYDFSIEYQDKADEFLSTWRICYYRQIMALGETYEDGSLKSILDDFKENGDMDLCALYLLTNLLPTSNRNICCKKSGKKLMVTPRWKLVNHIFQHQPIETDIDEYVKSKPPELTHPFLLCLGPSTSPQKFFLIIDHEALPAGDSTVAAFDRLFKAHHVFNAPFDPCLRTFFSFFGAVVYKCSPDDMTPQLRAFHLLLNSSRSSNE